MNDVSRYQRTVRALLAIAALSSVVACASSGGTVGHLPSRSPYEDLKPTQDLTLTVGHFGAETGAARVLPKPSVFAGARYDVPVGGPAFLTARYTYVPSERAFLLPSNPAATRFLGTVKTTTHVADVGLDIALTGRKTWHRMVPALAGGVGLASDFAKADTGGFKAGTRFAFTFGGNVRYVMRNGFAIRADATNYFWQNSYPETYLVRAADSTSVLTNLNQRSSWKGNWALSLGLVIPIFR